MTRSELKKLIADGETVHLECKLAENAIPANFWPSYSAFANTDGGTIMLGGREKDGKREIEGLPDAETCIFSLVRIGECSGTGHSQLYGNREVSGMAKPHFRERRGIIGHVLQVPDICRTALWYDFLRAA